MEIDFDKFKDVVARNCAEVPLELFNLTSVTGKSARDRIGELNGYLGRFRELYDYASLRWQLQKNVTNDIESMAIRELLDSPELKNKHGKITATVIDAYKMSHVTDTNQTLASETEILSYYEFALNRYKGMLLTIQATINSCQSMLAFDRTELNSLNHVV